MPVNVFLSISDILQYLKNTMFSNKFLKFCKVLKIGCLNSDVYSSSSLIINLQKRKLSFFLEWFIRVSNWPDEKRVKLVGPDCACAEWVLRNGALVRLKGESSFMYDYNELILLEETEPEFIQVEEIYGEKSNLHDWGFDHLKNCKYVKKITLISCRYVGDLGLSQLIYVKDSLNYLEISSSSRVKDKGLNELCKLRNLETLKLRDLPSVKNKNKCEMALKNALPKCKIDFLK